MPATRLKNWRREGMPDPRSAPDSAIHEWLAGNPHRKGASELLELLSPASPQRRRPPATDYESDDSAIARVCRALGLSRAGYDDCCANAQRAVAVMDAYRRHVALEEQRGELVSADTLRSAAFGVDSICQQAPAEITRAMVSRFGIATEDASAFVWEWAEELRDRINAKLREALG